MNNISTAEFLATLDDKEAIFQMSSLIYHARSEFVTGDPIAEEILYGIQQQLCLMANRE